MATAIADEIGPERTGFRISPGMPIGGLVDGEEGPALYRYLVAELDKLDLAYLHLIHDGDEALAQDIRKIWTNSLLLLRTKRSREALGEDVEVGLADVVPIGKWALANPDFIERFRRGAEFNAPDVETLFGGGAKGYVDYPALA